MFKKTISFARASLAIFLGCSYVAIAMYNMSKCALTAQSIAYEREIANLKGLSK